VQSDETDMSLFVEIRLSIDDPPEGVAGGRLRLTTAVHTGRGVDVGVGQLVTDMQRTCRLGRVENDGGWGRREPCAQASQHVHRFRERGCGVVTRLACCLLDGAKSVSETLRRPKFVVIVRRVVRMKSHLLRVWAADMQVWDADARELRECSE
jgi:hypothetical protein